MDGECAKTITGIVDQQDRVPNGLAERIDEQWARCVRVPAPELVALLAEASRVSTGNFQSKNFQSKNLSPSIPSFFCCCRFRIQNPASRILIDFE